MDRTSNPVSRESISLLLTELTSFSKTDGEKINTLPLVFLDPIFAGNNSRAHLRDAGNVDT
jgi:hypothetical protein